MFDNNRFGLITGSKCEVLFPERGDGHKGQLTYAEELANQKFFKYYDEIDSFETRHGHYAEFPAYEYYLEHKCKDAKYQPNFEMYMDYGGTADCICPEWGVDFKCPTKLSTWAKYLHRGIDKQQYYQAQMYMFLYDRPEWHICAFLLETEKMNNMGNTYPVEWKDRMIVTKVTKREGWSDLLLERGEPIIQMRNEFYNNLINNFRS